MKSMTKRFVAERLERSFCEIETQVKGSFAKRFIDVNGLRKTSQYSEPLENAWKHLMFVIV